MHDRVFLMGERWRSVLLVYILRVGEMSLRRRTVFIN